MAIKWWMSMYFYEEGIKKRFKPQLILLSDSKGGDLCLSRHSI